MTTLNKQAPQGLDLSKDKKQREIVQKWKQNDYKGTIVAVTGFGKTRVLLLAAHDYVTNFPDQDKSITIIVPSNKLEEDWKNHLQKCSIPWEVLTIQRLIRETKKTGAKRTGLLLIDEIHRFTSEEFGKVFQIYRYDYIFGATATLDEREGERYNYIVSKVPVLDTITLSQARKNDWVSDFTIYNLAIELTTEERIYYDKIHTKFVKYFSIFDYDFGLMMNCLFDKKARKSFAIQTGWDEGAVAAHAANAKRNIDKRKEFLYNLPLKIDIAKQIVDKFKDHVFITFSLSTDMADKLTHKMPDISVSYHSSFQTVIEDKNTGVVLGEGVDTDDGKKYLRIDSGELLTWKQFKASYKNLDLIRKGKGRRREEAIDLFKNPTNNKRVINTAKALDEGFNVPRINSSIVLARTSKSRQSIQRLGRMLRYIEGKRAFQVELYVPKTQDETWLRRCQINSTNIKWINSHDEIEP